YHNAAQHARARANGDIVADEGEFVRVAHANGERGNQADVPPQGARHDDDTDWMGNIEARPDGDAGDNIQAVAPDVHPPQDAWNDANALPPAPMAQAIDEGGAYPWIIPPELERFGGGDRPIPIDSAAQEPHIAPGA